MHRIHILSQLKLPDKPYFIILKTVLSKKSEWHQSVFSTKRKTVQNNFYFRTATESVSNLNRFAQFGRKKVILAYRQVLRSCKHVLQRKLLKFVQCQANKSILLFKSVLILLPYTFPESHSFTKCFAFTIQSCFAVGLSLFIHEKQ